MVSQIRKVIADLKGQASATFAKLDAFPTPPQLAIGLLTSPTARLETASVNPVTLNIEQGNPAAKGSALWPTQASKQT